MSGHSKWANIRHKKGKADAARGKIFSRLVKEITIAAKLGGGNPDGNPRLRLAIETARASSMPSANIDRAVKKGTGELEGVSYEELTYEGYGPGGVALLIECLTDNKTRTVADIRHLMSKHHGNLGTANSVSWMFDRKGSITVPKQNVSEDDMMMIALDCGAEDMTTGDDFFEITCAADELAIVHDALVKKHVPVESSKLTMIAKNSVNVDGKNAEQLLKLIDVLEDNDDVQNVFANFEMDDATLESLNK